MSGLTISDIRQLLISNKIKHRLTGYKHLNALLNNKTLLSSSSVEYENILRALFSAIRAEKNAFDNETSKARLIYAGDILKTFIEQFQSKLRIKIVKYTILEMKNAFLDDQDRVCMSLAHVLSKSWLCILENPSHIDPLSRNEYEELIIFTCEIIRQLIDSVSQLQNPRPPPSTTELFKSLECLLSARPNSILETVPHVISISTLFLDTFHVPYLVHSIVLSCLNELLLGVSLKNPEISRDICIDGLTRINALADSKVASVKENCLLFICHSYPVILYQMISGELSSDGIAAWAVPLFNKLARLPVADYLDYSDIEPGIGNHTGFLNLRLFKLNPRGNYMKWLLVLACTRLAMISAAAERLAGQDEELADIATLHRDLDVEKFLQAQGLESTLIYLQILSFAVQECQLSSDYACSLLSDMLDLSASIDSEISSWPMICYGCIIDSSEFDEDLDTFSSIRSILWDRACKKLFETKTSASTVFMTNVLINSPLSSIEEQAADIEKYIRLWDSHTPPLDQFSMNFCRALLHLKTESSSLVKAIYFKMYEWLSNAWRTELLSGNFSLAADSAPVISECFLLLSGNEPSFSCEFLYRYEGNTAYHDLRSAPVYEIWDYLNFKKTAAQLEPEYITEAPVDIPGDVSSLSAFCSNILKYFTGASHLHHRQTLHFLISYMLIVSELHETCAENFTSIDELCLKLQGSLLSKSDEPTAAALHEMTGILGNLKFSHMNKRTTHDLQALSSTFSDVLKAFYSQELNAVANARHDRISSETIFEDFLFIPSNIICPLHTFERLGSNIHIQGAQWLIYLRLIDRQQTKIDSGQYLCDIITVLCQSDALILWFLPLKKMFESSNVSDSQAATIIESLGFFLKKNKNWLNSEIALTIVAFFIKLTVPIWMDVAVTYSPDSRNILTEVEDLLNFIQTYMQKVVDLPFHLGLAVGGIFCSALIKNIGLAFPDSVNSVRAQLLDLVNQNNDVLNYHLAGEIAHLLVYTAPIDQLTLFLEIYPRENLNQVTTVLLRCRNISILTTHDFHISLLMSTLLSWASWGDLYKAHIRRIIEQLKKQNGVGSARELFRAMMPSILDDWFESKTPLDDFPVELCGYKSVLDFERDNFVTVLSQFVERADSEAAFEHIELVSSNSSIDRRDLYSAIFPRCLAIQLTKTDDLTDMKVVLESVRIPLDEVTLRPVSISLEILSVVDLSVIPPAFQNAALFSIINTRFRQLVRPKKRMLSVENGIQVLNAMSKYMAGRDFTSMLEESGVFLGIFTGLLGFNDKYTDSETKHLKIRQAMLLLFIAGAKPFSSSLVTDITIRMLLCYLSDDDLCGEVINELLFVLDSARKFIQDIKFWVKISASIVYSAQQANERTASRAGLKVLCTFLEESIFDVFFIQNVSENPELDSEIVSVVKLLHAVNERILHGVSKTLLDEQTALALMNLRQVKFKDIAGLFVSEFIQKSDSLILKTETSFSNAKLLLEELQEFGASTSTHLRPWLGRTLGQASLTYSTMDKSILECEVEDHEGKVVLAIVKLAVQQLESNDGETIAAACHAIQQLICKDIKTLPKKSKVPKPTVDKNLLDVFGYDDTVVYPLPEKLLHPLPQLPYEAWVKQISINFLSYIADGVSGAGGLQPLLTLSSSFCDAILPVMLQTKWSVAGVKNNNIPLISHLLSFYLRPAQNFEKIPVDYLRKKRKMIQILCSLRTVDVIAVSAPLLLLDAARTAYEIEMYKTALLLLELSQNHPGYNEEAGFELLSAICSKISDEDDPDLKHIIPETPSLARSIGVRGDKNDWISLSYQAATLDNSIMTNSTNTSPNTLVSSLNDLGMQGLSRITNEWDGADSNLKYAYAWKLMQWDIPVGGASLGTLDRNEVIFKMFKSVDNIYRSDKDSRIQQVFSDIYSHCMAFPVSTENLATMAIIKQCENIFGSSFSGGELTKDDCFRLEAMAGDKSSIDKWLAVKPYKDVEDLLTARQISWRMRNRYSNSEISSECFTKCLALSLVSAISCARETGLSHQTMNLTLQLGSLAERSTSHHEYENIRSASLAASANVMWDIGNQSHAINVLRSAIDSETGPQRKAEKWWSLFNDIVGLSQLVEWSYKARSDTQERIAEKYVAPALSQLTQWTDTRGEVSMAEKSAINSTAGLVFHRLAIFCEEQLNDPSVDRELMHLNEQIQQKEKEIRALDSLHRQATGQEKSDIHKRLRQVTRFKNNDVKERYQLQSNQQSLLSQSIGLYLKTMIYSNEFTEDTARFFALWFSHANESHVNEAVKEHLDSIPSARFIPWINQLTSHLTIHISESPFSRLITSLVIRMCRNHPHHCLYQVLALRMIASDETDDDSINRSKAGEEVWRNLSQFEDLKGTLAGIETLVLKIMDLTRQVKDASSGSQAATSAKRRRLNVKKPKKKNISLSEIPDGQWWSRDLADLNLPPPSLEIPLKLDRDYTSVPTMISMQNDILLATGLSRPMIAKIVLSDGSTHGMVIKSGIDDLRQDAIMEQVFDHVNGFLRSNVRTSRRDLNIRTYRVVPLTHNTGVLEFVDSAVALADILEPLHAKYRTHDLTIEKARLLMSHSQSSSANERIKVYRKITKLLKPVLSKFFLEKFFSPDDWFRTRTRFTRSNASASILGYIIGLGDRHCRNILLDTNSGDVVHIDLGIAFDQGKSLQIPETVPFRLTRDLVDGMGMPGTNGTFQKCCELTLDVLKKETLSILTIFNVLKYDPLYNWTLAPLKRKIQTEVYNMSDVPLRENDGNQGSRSVAEAEAALTSVRKKLSQNLSSEALTRDLIRQAESPENLGMIYSGWCPFL